MYRLLLAVVCTMGATRLGAQECLGLPRERASASLLALGAEGLQGPALGIGAATRIGAFGDIRGGYSIDDIGSSAIGAARLGWALPLGSFSSFCPLAAVQANANGPHYQAGFLMGTALSRSTTAGWFIGGGFAFTTAQDPAVRRFPYAAERVLSGGAIGAALGWMPSAHAAVSLVGFAPVTARADWAAELSIHWLFRAR